MTHAERSRTMASHGPTAVENLEREMGIPAHPDDQRPGSEPRLDMVNVLGWVQQPAPDSAGAQGTSPPDSTSPSLLVRAWVNNVAFAKEVWTDVYLLGDRGETVAQRTLDLRYIEPVGDNGDCFAGEAVACPPGSGRTSHPPCRLQFRLYYRVNGILFTDGLLHDHQLAGPSSDRSAAERRRSMLVSLILLHEASERRRRRR